MKKINNVQFPYPVLLEDGGDYNDSSFEMDFNLEVQNNMLVISCTSKIKCPFIEEQMKLENVILGIHIEQRTFRKMYNIKDFPIKIELDYLSPNHNIELVGLLIARRKFSTPYIDSMNEIFNYFDDDFIFERGSILGYSNFEEFELPADSKISSIFNISEYKNPIDIEKGEPFKIELGVDVINIQVLPEIKTKFLELRSRESSHNKIFNALFVYPAVQLAISEMFRNYDEYKDNKWCIAIANKLSNSKECSFEILRGNKPFIDKDELIEFTHIILGDLMLSAFVDASGEEE